MLILFESCAPLYFGFCNGDEPVFSTNGSHGGSSEWDNFISCPLYPLRVFVNEDIVIQNINDYAPPVIFEHLLGFVNYEPADYHSFFDLHFSDGHIIKNYFRQYSALGGDTAGVSFDVVGNQSGYTSHNRFVTKKVSLIAPNNPSKNFNDPKILSKFLKDYHA